jgi:Holliday junction resolvase RusA-like endonuclease
MISIILPGRPITKKNHERICVNSKTGKHFIRQSEQYEQYETDCLWRIKAQYRGPVLTEPISLKCLYWLPNRKGWPDLAGLIQATQDILQKAGVIENDKQVVSLDGSRIMGVDKDYPRTEVYICETTV